MPISQPWLQNPADLSHKIIRVHLGAGEAKATLAGESYPSQILPAFHTQVFTIPALLSSASQHFLHHLIVIPRIIQRMATFELIPVVLKYLTKGVPINCLHLSPSPLPVPPLYHNPADFIEKKCKFLCYELSVAYLENARGDMFTAISNRLHGKTTSRVERVFRTVNMRINVGKWSMTGGLNVTKVRLAYYYNGFDA
jgi:hypothetical protein